MTGCSISSMAKLTVTPVPALRDNYIWVIHDDRSAVVVDPGDATPVRAFLAQFGLRLQAILCTHWQPDHTGGICALQDESDVPVYGPANEDIRCVTHGVGEGASIEVAALQTSFDVIEIPGHTRGHLGFLWDGAVFCGDTLFGAGCGRVFDGTLRQLFESLKRLAALPDETRVYCSHEYTEANLRFALACEPDNPSILQRQLDTRTVRGMGRPSLPSTIGLEKATNPFLRCDRPQVVEHASRHAGQALVGEFEVFSCLRGWRSEF